MSVPRFTAFAMRLLEIALRSCQRFDAYHFAAVSLTGKVTAIIDTLCRRSMWMIGKTMRPYLLGALALTAASGMAAAQQGGGSGAAGHGMAGGGMMGRGMTGGVLKPEQRRAAAAEGRIAFLKSALGIKENQLEAWNAYADALRAKKSTGRGMRGSGMMGGGKGKAAHTTAMQQIDKRIERMEASIADLKALKPRADALYKVLDDDQKKKANALLLRRGR